MGALARTCLDTTDKGSLGWEEAEVAQVVEHGTENAGVASSTLALGTSRQLLAPVVSGSGSVVEHLLAKEKVAGSNPVFRSTFISAEVAEW